MNNRKVAIICSYLLIAVDIVVGIFFVPFLLGELGESEYGLYKLLFSMASYLSVLDFGLGSTITRYVVKYRTEGKPKEEQNFVAMGMILYLILVGAVMILAVILSLCIPAMYASSIPAGKMRYAQGMFLVICAATAVNLLNHAYNGLVSAYEAFVFSKVSNIVKVALRVGMIVVGVSLKASAYIIVVTDLTLAIGLLLVNMVYTKYKLKVRIKLHGWDKAVAKEAMVFTLAILFQSIINQFNSNVDNIVLGIFTTTATVAVYSIALQLYLMYSNLSTAISTIYFPSISKAVFAGESDEEITEKVIAPSRIQLLILLLALTGFYLFGMDFITLWVGEKYHIVYVLGIILLTSSTLELSQNTITSVLKAKNILHGKTLILGISTAFNVLLTFLLVPRFGVIGAAVGTAFSMVFGYGVALNVYYQKRAKLCMKLYFNKTFSGILPAALLSIPFGVVLNRLIKCNGYFDFMLEAGVYVAVYFAFMMLIGLNRREKEAIFGTLSKKAFAERLHKKSR